MSKFSFMYLSASLLAVVLVTAACGRGALKSARDARFDASTRITCGGEHPTVPDSWLSDEVRFHVVPETPASERSHAVRSRLEQFIERHGMQPLLVKHDIYIVLYAHIYANSHSLGATYYRSTIYINLDRLESRDEDSACSTFVHELSSILLLAHAECLDREAWTTLCHPEFPYADDDYAIASSAGIGTPSMTHATIGYVNAYSMSSFENDFNCLSELLWTDPALLDRMVQVSTILKQKRELAVRFYGCVDKMYSASYFASLMSQTVPDR